MKYFTIEIKPKRGKWEVSHYLDEADRVDDDPGPNPLGFYHCPESKGLTQGFKELKDHMIKQHEDRIINLQNSLAKLREVKL